MKHSSWFRFGLIVLCIAMAMSMFACGGGKDETTEKPGQETTEKPTEQTTEKPTEAPTKETTEAPTTETTEAPTTETTEAPTTETTETPTTETTEAPTTETTEAPTTETTEAPTTETTETPTTETTENPNAEIIEKIPVFFGKEELQAVTPNDGLYAEPTDDGMYFINDFNMDGNFTLFSKRAAEEGPTGQYLFIKYRASDKTRFTFYTSTVNGSPAYQNEWGMYAIGDEEWHFLILDMSAKISSYIKPADDGQYYVQHLRIDIEGGEGIWAELAYVGYAANVDDIIALAKAYDPEMADGFCPCDPILAEAEYTDATVHAAVCKLCGKSESSAHVTGTKAVWNAETGRYETECTVCGGVAAKDWQWIRDFTTYADGTTFAGTGGGMSHKVTGGVLVMTPNGNAAWGGIAIGCDGAGTLGQYYVFKYKVTELASDAEVAKFNLRFNNKTATIEMIADGEWHVAVVDLAATLGVEAANGSFESTGDHWFLNYADANLIKYEVAFEACADALDRIPEEYRPAQGGEETTEKPPEETTETPEPPVENTTVSSTIESLASSNSWENGVAYPEFKLNADITVSSSGTPVGNYGLNTGKYYTSDLTWRIYQNESPVVTITAADGMTIVSVKITYISAKTGILTHAGAQIASDTVIEVNANSVSFGVANTGTATNGQVKITAIEVVYAAGSSEEETTEKLPEDVCEHEAGAELDVYEVVGDGSGLEYYATCAKCGEKVTRPISVYRNHWDNTIGANESVSCGVGFCGGWSVITGGILEYRFVLTNANDPTETVTIVVAVTGENGGVKNAAPAKYGENRGFSGGKTVNVADWSNVEGVDFIGDDVTITIYAVSKADPEADPILLEADLGPVKPAHSVVAGKWVEENQQYQGACGCGSITDQVMDANIYFEAEKLTIGGVWGSGQRVETDGDVTYAWVQSNNGAGAWCNTYFSLNPAQAVSGQYLVFRYRAPAAVANNTLVIKTDANSGYTQTVNVELDIDNEWHIVIIDLAEYGFNAESVFSNNSRLDLTSWGAGEYIQFDWFRMYDSYDHIPAEYKGTVTPPEEDTTEKLPEDTTEELPEDTTEKLPEETTEKDPEETTEKDPEETTETPEHTHEEEIIPGKDATCTETGLTEGKKCSVCGEILKEQTEIEALGHTWDDATCTVAKTCSVCGETEGEALGHTWDDATCTAAKTCSVCGATEGEALGHTWNDATCTVAKTCSVCGATEGEALGHTWNDAVCTAPATCTVCGETTGEALGHTWNDATCTVPATCSVCGATEGEALGHTWNDATCTAPETCAACGETQGTILGHEFAGSNNEYCSRCNKFIKVTNVYGLFNLFYGGTGIPAATKSGEKYLAESSWSANGYRLITRTEDGESYVSPSFPENYESGQYLVVKYKATGSINFEFFMSTVQAGAKGGWSFGHTPEVYGEWQYFIVDLTKVLPADAMVAENGKYCVKGMRMDIQGIGDVEIAYIAMTSTVEDLINGVKKLEGVRNVKADYCLCSTLIQTAAYADEFTHTGTCMLCGSVYEGLKHIGATCGTWTGTYYESDVECSVCGEKYNTSYQSWVDYSTFAEGHKFGHGSVSGHVGSHVVTGGLLSVTVNGNTAWGGVSVGQIGATVGQYYVLKYRVPEGGAVEGAETVGVYLRFANKTQLFAMIADGEWHTAVIDLATFTTSVGNGMVSTLNGSDPDHWFCIYADANLLKFEVAYEGFADRLDGIPDDVCDCPAFAQKAVDANKCQLTCQICGDVTTVYGDAHTETVLPAILPGCVTDGATEGRKCSVCDYVIVPSNVVPADGTCGGGSNNEYCVDCHKFLNVEDPSTLFNKFIGGEGLPYVSSLGSMPGTSGYILYNNINGAEKYVQPSYDGSETGQFMVMKFKATGSMNFDFFTSTVQSGASGSYTFNYTPAVKDEWQYLIVDLSKKIGNNGVVVDGNGKYCIKGLRLDVQGVGTAEIAYIAYANSIEKLLTGIKTLEGVEKVDSEYCLCDNLIQVGTYADALTHIPVCQLCGKQGEATGHIGANYGTWSEDLGYYVSNSVCSVCNEYYNFGSVLYVEWETVNSAETAWNTGNVNGTDGDIKYGGIYSKNGAGTWANGYFRLNPNGLVTGQYMAIKYRVPGTLANSALSLSNGFDATYTVKVDNEWHILIVDCGVTTIPSCRFNCTAWGANESIQIDWVKTFDSLDRIPGLEDMDHNCSSMVVALETYEAIGGGTGLEYCGECAICGTKVKQALSYKSSWDTMYTDNGSAVLYNGTIMGGWTIMTGGVEKGIFVISDGENTTEVEFLITAWDSGVATQGSNKYGYMGPDRGYSRYNLTIEDWSNVNGIDFTGKKITITAYAVPKADNTIRIKTVSARPATVAENPVPAP